MIKKYWIVFLALGVFAIGIASPFILSRVHPNASPEKLSQLGGWLGGTSAPLIGFAGFLMVLAAFMLQREELGAQREELQLTREEFHEQNTTLRMQRFENTFFNLLRFHYDIVEKLGRVDESSRQFFGRMYNALETRQGYDLDRKRKGTFDPDMSDSALFIEVSFPEVFIENQADLGHYFRNLYHILRFVHTSPVLTTSERQFYARIVRAQLSSHELVLLFYNALPPSHGYPKLKFLLDRYDMLQNIDERLLRWADHIDTYRAARVIEDPFIERAAADHDAA
jgi:hypothetical protein